MSLPYRVTVELAGDSVPLFTFREHRCASLKEAREKARSICPQYPRYIVYIRHDDGRYETWSAIPQCTSSFFGLLTQE